MTFQLVGGDTGNLDAVVNQVNQNIAQLKVQDTTNIFKDDSGTRRVLLGKGKDGFYGLKVSQEGTDVYDGSNEDMTFNSDNNVFKVVGTGTLTITEATINTGGANYGTGTPVSVSVAHGLDYAPAIVAFWDNGGTYSSIPRTLMGTVSSGAFAQFHVAISVDATNVTGSMTSFGYNVNTSQPATTIKYYLFQETAS